MAQRAAGPGGDPRGNPAALHSLAAGLPPLTVPSLTHWLV